MKKGQINIFSNSITPELPPVFTVPETADQQIIDFSKYFAADAARRLTKGEHELDKLNGVHTDFVTLASLTVAQHICDSLESKHPLLVLAHLDGYAVYATATSIDQYSR